MKIFESKQIKMLSVNMDFRINKGKVFTPQIFFLLHVNDNEKYMVPGEQAQDLNSSILKGTKLKSCVSCIISFKGTLFILFYYN